LTGVEITLSVLRHWGLTVNSSHFQHAVLFVLLPSCRSAPWSMRKRFLFLNRHLRRNGIGSYRLWAPMDGACTILMGALLFHYRNDSLIFYRHGIHIFPAGLLAWSHRSQTGATPINSLDSSERDTLSEVSVFIF